MPSIVGKIETVEKEIADGEKKLDVLERKLRLADLNKEERSNLEVKEQTLKDKIDQLRKELRSLRFENFKTMIMSVMILAVIYGVYYLFTSGGSNDNQVQNTS